MVAAVLGEVVFDRLCRSGARLFGRWYEVDTCEETRPDAFCSRCCGWGHIAPHCAAASPRCAVCAKDYATNDHRCPVDGWKAWKGRPCPTRRPSALIAGAPMGRGRMPARPRGWPTSWQGGESRRPHHAGSGGRRGLRSLPRTRLLRLRPRSP